MSEGLGSSAVLLCVAVDVEQTRLSPRGNWEQDLRTRRGGPFFLCDSTPVSGSIFFEMEETLSLDSAALALSVDSFGVVTPVEGAEKKLQICRVREQNFTVNAANFPCSLLT